MAGLLLAVLLTAGCGPGHAKLVSSPAPSPRPSPAGGQAIQVASPTVRRPELDVLGPPGMVIANDGPGPEPLRLQIPALGLDSNLARLGLNPDGTIEVPGNFDQPGWYTGGPAPGDLGPAVILGHLDSFTGPAVFSRLSHLRPADQVLVTRQNGNLVRFQVSRVASFARDSFPTREVYGPTTEPALRLITCGGVFNALKQSYPANLVVFAVTEG